MKYSQSFTKTLKEAPKDEVATNAKLLIRAGYIDKEMAGVYSFLPLGVRVLAKIEQIVREEMNTIGQEVLLPALAPKELWEKTGRINTVDVLYKVNPANEHSAVKNNAEYILNSTHEEIVTPISQKYNFSYKDLPRAVYQIQTKFRNEPRAKSGLLRCREFRMKDLYSFHVSEQDLLKYYEVVKKAYWNVYERLGLKDLTYVTSASGGDFTKDFSHEFQVLCEAGEDTIYINPETHEAYNKEIFEEVKQEGISYDEKKACEVGNIFPLNTKFSDAFDYTYTDENGEKHPVYMGSYGIGPSRLMGVLVEIFHDERGIKWPKEVAPYDAHLITLGEQHHEKAQKLIASLEEQGIEVLWDDRTDAGAGAKFADCDLIGIPTRLVISDKTGDQIEVKERESSDQRLISAEEVVSVFK